MMPQINANMIPGVKGKDYKYVKYGGKIYVVYQVKLPNGRSVRMSWAVNKDDYKALNVDPGRVQQISRAQHRQLAFFGDASEIGGGDPGEHPFQKYLSKLRELHGGVSWMSDKQFMGVMLMGYAEGWTAEELRQRLTRTKWYQSRTDAQRTWELDTNKAQRNATTETWATRATDAMQELYGEAFTLDEVGVTSEQLRKAATDIASGKWGDPSEGFEIWLSQQRNKAEKVEGTNAWIEKQQEISDRNQFLNRPEEMFEQLRQDAMTWLGPSALPDQTVLRGWSERLVSGVASEADWQSYIEGQAKALYPWLGPNETWTDRAAPYKRIAEDTWGTPIGWDNGVLSNLGATGPDGKPLGTALTYQDFTEQVRKRNEFWQGPVAREEGFDLFNFLNNTFNGVPA